MSDSSKPKRPWYVNCLFVFGAFIVLIVIIVAASGGSSNSGSSSSSSTNNGTTAADASYALKAEAPAGDLSFIANP